MQDFNGMAERLEGNIHELQENARRQEEFTGAFAHELKTPLTSIIGYAEMLMTMELGEEELRQSADYIYREGKRLERLSYKMMELIRVGKLGAQLGEVSTPLLGCELEKLMRARLDEKQLSLRVELEEATLRGDLDLLLSLLGNLVDNSRKACEAGGNIRVSGCICRDVQLEGKRQREDRCGGIYRIEVHDDGRGIPEAELGKITEAFYMVDKSRARKEGGAGLGMAICARIVEAHGASWEIASKDGEGTCVTVFFLCVNGGKRSVQMKANRIKRGILTIFVLLLLIVCVGAALTVPQTVSGWYEEQALGQVAYEDMSYEPYEIRYYESFEEKMEAIAVRKSQGIQTYSLRIGERTDNITNEDLIEIANEELAKLYGSGLLPEEIHIRSLIGRSFMELYEIQNKEKTDSLRNVYLWELDCVTDYGTIQIRMDNEYYKIYAFSLYQEPHGGDEEQWDEWKLPYMLYDRAAVAQGWIDYWELPGAMEETEVYKDIFDSDPLSKVDTGESYQWPGGETTMWLYINLQSGSTVILSVNLYGYYQKGWGVSWSLYDM